MTTQQNIRDIILNAIIADSIKDNDVEFVQKAVKGKSLITICNKHHINQAQWDAFLGVVYKDTIFH